MAPDVAVVVPSLGVAPGLDETIDRLRRELDRVDGELVWVHQGRLAAPQLPAARARLLRRDRPAGFAVAANLGCAATDAAWIALVNDDVWVEPGWLAELLAAARRDPRIVALQGLNLNLDAPGELDGAGLGWNRRWQAVQLGHGEPSANAPGEPFEVFGVSATAALYRRSALATVARPSAAPFDERLESWYEDVDLAIRLAARGGRSLVVPAAIARHRGSATGATRPYRRARLLMRNRWLVTARLLGRSWTAALPAIARGDLAELAAAVRDRRWRALAALPAAWAGAALRLPGAVHRGAPAVPLAELDRHPAALPGRAAS